MKFGSSTRVYLAIVLACAGCEDRQSANGVDQESAPRTHVIDAEVAPVVIDASIIRILDGAHAESPPPPPEDEDAPPPDDAPDTPEPAAPLARILREYSYDEAQTRAPSGRTRLALRDDMYISPFLGQDSVRPLGTRFCASRNALLTQYPG